MTSADNATEAVPASVGRTPNVETVDEEAPPAEAPPENEGAPASAPVNEPPAEVPPENPPARGNPTPNDASEYNSAVPSPTIVELASPAPVRSRNRRDSELFRITSHAITQNNRFGGKKYQPPRLTSRHLTFPENNEEDDLDSILSGVDAPQKITINGIDVPLVSRPSDGPFVPPKRWNSVTRRSLDAETLDLFWRSAGGYVLPKSNKIESLGYKLEEDKLVFYVKNLQTQLQTLRDHCYTHDILEVFTIVVPEDANTTSRISERTYDLFTDHAKLHPTVVANSNAWYNLWVRSPAVRENLLITLDLVRNNVDPKLWSQAFEDHNEFTPVQRGGPLVLFFVLKRALDVSETSMQYLLTRVKALKISSLPGENVDEAVSLIKSVYTALKQCSTDVRNFVPDDFPETVLKVFQTTSVPAFNKVFEDEESQARRAADKYSGMAQYPSVSTTCTLAVNVYRRMSSPGDDYRWVAPTKQGSAFSATSNGNDKALPRLCFNCGKPNCKPSICKEPIDRERIKRASAERARRLGKDPNQSSGGGRTPKTPKKDDYGRPLKKNKNGVFVVDQRALKEQGGTKLPKGTQKKLSQLEKQIDALVAGSSSSESQSTDTSTTTSTSASANTSSTGTPGTASFVARAHEVQSLISAIRRGTSASTSA